MADSGDSCDDSKTKKRREKKYHHFTQDNESPDEENIVAEKSEQASKTSSLQKKSKPSKLFKKPSFTKGMYLCLVFLHAVSLTFKRCTKLLNHFCRCKIALHVF